MRRSSIAEMILAHEVVGVVAVVTCPMAIAATWAAASTPTPIPATVTTLLLGGLMVVLLVPRAIMPMVPIPSRRLMALLSLVQQWAISSSTPLVSRCITTSRPHPVEPRLLPLPHLHNNKGTITY